MCGMLKRLAELRVVRAKLRRVREHAHPGLESFLGVAVLPAHQHGKAHDAFDDEEHSNATKYRCLALAARRRHSYARAGLCGGYRFVDDCPVPGAERVGEHGVPTVKAQPRSGVAFVSLAARQVLGLAPGDAAVDFPLFGRVVGGVKAGLSL